MTIDNHIKPKQVSTMDDDGNCYQVMKLVPKAIDGDAHSAAVLWRELASDSRSANDSDIRRWIQHVAQRLVTGVIDSTENGSTKATAARAAVGLSGQVGAAEMRVFIAESDAIWRSFSGFDEEGNLLPERALGWGDHVHMALQLIDMGMVEPPPRNGKKQYVNSLAKRVERIRADLPG